MKLAFNLMSLPGERVFGVGMFLREMCRDVEAELAARSATLDVFHHADCDAARLFGLAPSARVRLVPVAGMASRIRRVAWEQFSLPGRVRGADLLYSPNNVNPLRLPSGTRSIVTIHDLLPFDAGTRFGGLQQAYLRRFTIASARRAARVITVSQTSATDIQRLLDVPAGRIDVVRNVVQPPASIAPAGAGADRSFVIVASVHADKRIDLALRGFQRFAARHAGYRLEILGSDHGALADLQALTASLGLGEQVSFRGYVDDDAKWSALAACAGVLLFGRKEGFGIPVLEAMAVGKPSIVAPEGALPEVVGDAGIVVAPEDADAVAAALERLAVGPGIPAATIARRYAEFDGARQRRRFWDLLSAAAT